MNKTTKINGYLVELDLDGNDDGITQCFITKGNYSASLEALSGTGCLSDSNWEDVRVLPETIEAIYNWATDNGY